MITIGQLAGYVGVTVRAVRHYHHLGLLDEPGRDASGYRRYTAQHAIDLVKIKTLASAGVPLARIKQLSAAQPDEFTAAIDQIDRDLKERIADLRRTRDRIRSLAGGDRMFVPEEVANYLGHLRTLGLSDRYVEIEHDLWMLQWAVQPDYATRMLADRIRSLLDPQSQKLILDFDRAFNADPSDPSLVDLAGRMVTFTVLRYGFDETAWAGQDPIFDGLVQASVASSSPAWNEISRVVAEEYRSRQSQDN